MKDISSFIMWLFVGAIGVLIITHASGFATAIMAVGGQVTNDASLLAGYAPSTTGIRTTATPNPGGLGNMGAPSVVYA